MPFDDNNILTITFDNVDYENGNLVVLLFLNETKDKYSALRIDFSETGIPTFQSEIQRNRVVGNSLSRSASIIVDENIPGTINDTRQEYNKNVEPPMASDRSEPQPYSHSYSSAVRAPEVWVLEGNTGAYVYKKSISYDGYKSMSSKVLLSQAKLKFDSYTHERIYLYVPLTATIHQVRLLVI